jgi:hypothetical protein
LQKQLASKLIFGMRIVQSFWSCNKSLLKNSFGWLSPQHHLMAWTLSCLTIHKYYEDLHLYTDTNGHEIFIKYLNLPYKSTQIVYDDIDGKQENNFAIVKMLTYASQREPFIHVDGDVFIWQQFDPALENAELIAQNQEKGTEYYKSIMEGLKKALGYLPDFLEKELNKISIPSYNAGILGGNDLDFLNRYANIGLDLIEKNYTSRTKLGWGFNILFEQILFYSLSKKEDKKVICFLDETIEDFGYSKEKFADFSLVPDRLKYLHLIGDKKRDAEISELMSRTLFQHYPEYFYRIINLFKNEHIHFNTKIKACLPDISQYDKKIKTNVRAINTNSRYRRTRQAIRISQNTNKTPTLNQIKIIIEKSNLVELKEVFQYEKQLAIILNNWTKITPEFLHAVECINANSFESFLNSKQLQLTTMIGRNPYLEIIENSFDWTLKSKNYINPNLVSKSPNGVLGLACIPILFFSGYNEIVIDELDYNILTILENPMFLKDIQHSLEDCFNVNNKDDNTVVYRLMLIRLKRLFLNRSLFIKTLP